MVSQVFNSERITDQQTGQVYKISSGSGGSNASYESVAVYRTDVDTYKVRYTTPASATTLRKDIVTAEEAITYAREIAPKKISVGLPGSGKISLPEFDTSEIPSEN